MKSLFFIGLELFLLSQSVLARVLGSNPSFINGILRSDANLFLVNPNGIIFGFGARLDVSGLFSASTATSVGFSTNDILTTDDFLPPDRYPSSLGFPFFSNPIVNLGNLSNNQGISVASLFNYASIPISSVGQSVGNTLVLSQGVTIQLGDTATRPVQADSLIVQSLSGQVVNIPLPTPTPTPTPEPTTLKPADLDLVAIAPDVSPVKSTAGLSVEFHFLTDFNINSGG